MRVHIDEPRQNDHPLHVSDFRIRHLQTLPAHLPDTSPFYQYISARIGFHASVHRENPGIDEEFFIHVFFVSFDFYFCSSTTHRSMFRVSLEKFTPTLKTCRPSAEKGRAYCLSLI